MNKSEMTDKDIDEYADVCVKNATITTVEDLNVSEFECPDCGDMAQLQLIAQSLVGTNPKIAHTEHDPNTYHYGAECECGTPIAVRERAGKLELL